MKKPAMSFVSIVVLAIIAYLAITVAIPYLQKQGVKETIKPINSGGYREYDHSKPEAQNKCATLKKTTRGYTTYETCYDKNGKALYTKKIVD